MKRKRKYYGVLRLQRWTPEILLQKLNYELIIGYHHLLVTQCESTDSVRFERQ